MDAALIRRSVVCAIWPANQRDLRAWGSSVRDSKLVATPMEPISMSTLAGVDDTGVTRPWVNQAVSKSVGFGWP
jgi:hypothetical protein